MRVNAISRPGILLASLLLAVLGSLAVIADRSLAGHVERESRSREAASREEASRAGLGVRSALATLEQAVAFGEDSAADVAWSVTAPPAARVPGRGARSYAALPRPSLALLVSSREVSPSGLPVAAVAALALGDAASRAEVGRALLAGELPVAPDDVAVLAEALGADAGAAALLRTRLASLPALSSLPEIPAFRREVEGSRVTGWARARGRVVHYQVEVTELLRAASLAERVRLAAEPGRGGRAGLPIDVPDLEALALVFVPAAETLRPRALRIVLWAAVLTCAVAVVALGRSLEHQRRLVTREREFLATITHELRTPVAAVRLFGETLAQGRGDSREYGQMIADESQRLEALSERVLTAARLEGEPRLADCDPRAVIDDALAPIRPRAAQAGQGLVESLGPLPRACWDALAVCHAVRNLVDNALRHGARTVSIDADVDDVRGTLSIAVTDDGPGISRRDRSRIFDRFERGATTSSGVGLGLWLVDRVARTHGGRVDLESEPGMGARFTLELPLQPGLPRPQDASAT